MSERKYKQLSVEERQKIYDQRKAGRSMSAIGKELGRSKSCISQELKRNKREGLYNVYYAQQLYKGRRAGKRVLKIDRNPRLREQIVQHMRDDGWAPDAIAGRLGAGFCTETLYQWIYKSPFAIEHTLYGLLPSKRQQRLKRISRRKRATIPDRVSINERPMIASMREEIGHFESDLTFHTGNRSRNIGASVDKKSQKLFLTLNRCKKAKTVMTNIMKWLKNLPLYLRKTMTFDNGGEFSQHVNLRLLGIDTYFCDPYSPQQKPLVEKMNSMIHRLLPKATNIKKVSAKTISIVQDKLNNMPRRILGYKTPNEVWNENLSIRSTLN